MKIQIKALLLLHITPEDFGNKTQTVEMKKKEILLGKKLQYLRLQAEKTIGHFTQKVFLIFVMM